VHTRRYRDEIQAREARIQEAAQGAAIALRDVLGEDQAHRGGRGRARAGFFGLFIVCVLASVITRLDGDVNGHSL
jgi:hypothetical protein